MNNKKKNVDYLQKRIPKNPKYEGIESSIDTGASVSRYLRKIEEIKQNYRIKKDELFRRMKVSTFVQLLLQVAEINGHLYCNNNNSNSSFIPELPDENADNRDDYSDAGTIATVDTQRSTFQSVINGVGELDMHERNSNTNQAILPTEFPAEQTEEEMPYLILDVRERDEYDQSHIIKSMSYPSAMICRSVNYESREMLQYRNRAGKIIILYDEDERIAPRVADTLVQRGYDNLFLLSGGLRMAYKKFPRGLITGSIPQSIIDFAKSTANKRSSSISGKSKSRLPSSSASSISGSSNQNGTSNKQIESDQLPSNVVIQSEFTMEDLAHLSLALDAADDQSSNASSSIYSRQSKDVASRQESISNSQVEHKRAFRC